MKPFTFITFLIFSSLIFLSSCKSEKSSDKNIVTLTSENFSNETEKGMVLVDFWASWCVPCRAMSPVISGIAEETLGKVKVCKVDIDAQGALANQFRITSIPTLIIFKDGQPVETLVGMKSKSAIMDALAKHMKLK